MADTEIKTITTYAEREQILSKDYLTIYDIMKLLGVTYYDASARMGVIRATVGDRLKIKGKIHTQDYLDFYHLPANERYARHIEEQN